MGLSALNPLGTARVAALLGAVRCLICDWDNSRGSEICRRCQMPLGLAEEAARLGQDPRPLMVAGSPGSGASTWLGLATDVLARGVGPYRLELYGASSLALPQETTSAFSSRRYPGPTPTDPASWAWIHGRILGAGRPIGPAWLVPDLPGRSLLTTLERSEESPLVTALLTRATGLVLCVNRTDLASGDEAEEQFVLRLLALAGEMHRTERRTDRRPVAIVLVDHEDDDGWDSRPATEDPAAAGLRLPRRPPSWPGASPARDDRLTLARLAPRLTRTLIQRAGVWDVFPIRVAPVGIAIHCLGGTSTLPLRLEPSGLAAPLIWLTFQVRGQN